jgi:tRNA(adenine34) deaminase
MMRSRGATGKKTAWVHAVRTDSTHPPPGTFTRPAAEIARIMARKDVSPRGLGSAIRMVQYVINRAGRTLSPARRAELERAKRLLQRRAARNRAMAARAR